MKTLFKVEAVDRKGRIVFSSEIESESIHSVVHYAKSHALLDARCSYKWLASEVDVIEWEPESQEVQDEMMARERGIRSVI